MKMLHNVKKFMVAAVALKFAAQKIPMCLSVWDQVCTRQVEN
jgi:hypothetical protein